MNTCNLTLKKYRCNFISLLIFIENGHYTSVSKLREAYSYKKKQKSLKKSPMSIFFLKPTTVPWLKLKKIDCYNPQNLAEYFIYRL